MRILICNKFYFEFGGTDIYVLQLEEMLKEHGHQVAIFSTDHPSNRDSPYQRHFLPYMDLKDPKLSIVSKVRLAQQAIYSIRARRAVRGLIKEFRPDIAHIRNVYHHISPSIFWEFRSWNIPVIYHVNDFKCLCPNYNFISNGHVCEKCKEGKFWNVVAERCHSYSLGSNLTLCAEAYLHSLIGTYRKCVKRFIAPSGFCKDKLIEYGFDPGKIEVLYHFQSIRDDPHDNLDEGYILFVGRLSPEKGLRDLLSVMQGLPHISLWVAGDGPIRPELEAWTRDKGLNNVRFLGKLKERELYRIIRGSRFTVMPSLVFETFGKVILESYAQGRTVISSNLGTRPELVEDGVTGLLYEPNDMKGLAERISYLYNRPEVCRVMGQHGKSRVTQRHSPEIHYEKLSRIYRELLVDREEI